MGSCGGKCKCGKSCYISDDFCESHICFDCREKQKASEAANPDALPLKIEELKLITAKEAKEKATLQKNNMIDKDAEKHLAGINSKIQHESSLGNFSTEYIVVNNSISVSKITDILESSKYGYTCSVSATTDNLAQKITYIIKICWS
jgi:hypothetical protein